MATVPSEKGRDVASGNLAGNERVMDVKEVLICILSCPQKWEERHGFVWDRGVQILAGPFVTQKTLEKLLYSSVSSGSYHENGRGNTGLFALVSHLLFSGLWISSWLFGLLLCLHHLAQFLEQHTHSVTIFVEHMNINYMIHAWQQIILYLLAVAALINHHKLYGLKRYRLIISELEVRSPKINMSGAALLLEALGRAFPLSFPASGSCWHPLALSPSLHLQSLLHLPLTLTLLPPCYKEPCDYMWSTRWSQIIYPKILGLITFCHVRQHSHRLWDQGMDIFGRDINLSITGFYFGIDTPPPPIYYYHFFLLPVWKLLLKLFQQVTEQNTSRFTFCLHGSGPRMLGTNCVLLGLN